jgi:hypothetical protein
LRLAVPDFAACARLYVANSLNRGLLDLIGLICGRQNDPYNYHNMVFDEPTLTDALRSVGFRNVRRWDWRQTEHAHVDDFSSPICRTWTRTTAPWSASTWKPFANPDFTSCPII